MIHLRRPIEIDSGYALIEVLVAASLLVSALAIVAQVFAAATQARRGAEDTTRATVLAQQKIEELIAAAARPGAIALSPPGAIGADTAGFSERVDGRSLRWSIEPLPAAPSSAVVIRVVVLAAGARRRASADLATVRRTAS